ncbi:hypothetical protein GCM10027449_29350 [Sinomonas notoginsengisoli]|uniref:hypothetical protein n=1 Tax=Sinomonas notoginsengisoli TaxID=1457311 RepID=UPI001F38C14D|nr:hypothetical protein [Sinomonas notoginsengisoli]
MCVTTILAVPAWGSSPERIAVASRAELLLEVAHTGQRLRLSRAASLAAKSILAMALENAAQHADSTRPVTLSLLWQPAGLTIHVLNVPGETAIGQLLRPGRGIASMMARAQHAGGWLRSGLCTEGFEVEAFLPAPARASVLPHRITAGARAILASHRRSEVLAHRIRAAS